LSDETDLSNRFAACAVSSDWILSGNAVKGWAPPHKNKEPIPGEAAPDLIKMTLNSSCVKPKKKKKKKPKKESTTGMEDAAVEAGADSVKKVFRGKRGSRKKKIKLSQIVGDENIRDTAYKPPKRKKKRPDEIDGTREIIMTPEEIRESKISRALYKEFKRSVCGEPNREQVEKNGAELEQLPKKGKRKKKKRSLTSQLAALDLDQSLNILMDLKKMKKKKRRKERESELPVPVMEDEGFDSDPTKADMKRQQRKLLKAKLKELKKQRKSEKKWQNSMEYLSKDLASLAMTPVKED